MLQLKCTGLILTPVNALDCAEGSIDVQVKIEFDNTYAAHTKTMHIGYFDERGVEHGVSSSLENNVFKIPGPVFAQAGIIFISVHFSKTGDTTELETNAVQYRVQKTAGGVGSLPGSYIWEPIVKGFVNDYLESNEVKFGTDTTLTQSGKAADAKAVGDEFSKLWEDIDDLKENGVSGGSGGQPITVSLASEMNDTTKTYLYVGSEEGYTNGDWYYYDNTTSTWVSGGAYGEYTLPSNLVYYVADEGDEEVEDEESGESGDTTSGSTVVVIPTLTNGTEIAKISVDGVEKTIYAPTPTSGENGSSGGSSSSSEKEWTLLETVDFTNAENQVMGFNFEVNDITEILVFSNDMQNESSSDSAYYLSINDIMVNQQFVRNSKSGTTKYHWAHAKFNGLVWESEVGDSAINTTNVTNVAPKKPYNYVKNVGKASKIRFAMGSPTYASVSGTMEIYVR